MTIKVHVKVLQDDIKGGFARDAYSCPVALAMSRALTESGFNVEELEVDEPIKLWGFYDDLKGISSQRFSIRHMPKDVQDFINDFDSDKEVHEFEFDAEFEEDYLEDDI